MSVKPCPDCGNNVSDFAEKCPQCGRPAGVQKQPIKAKTSSGTLLVFFLIIGSLYIATTMRQAVNESQRTISESPDKVEKIPPKKIKASDAVELLDSSGTKEGFGMIGSVSFKIKNGNAFPVKDIVVACESFAPSGTVLSKNNETIFEKLDPGQTKIFKNVNIGFINSQATRFDCKIKDVSVY